MIKLTDAERELRTALITNHQRADAGTFPPGSFWLEFADGDPQRLTRMAYHVNVYEKEHGRPELSYFGKRGDSADTIATARAFWRGDPLERLIAVQDAQFDALTAELSTIKQQLRALLYGGEEG